jgi:hypothetical protein
LRPKQGVIQNAVFAVLEEAGQPLRHDNGCGPAVVGPNAPDVTQVGPGDAGSGAPDNIDVPNPGGPLNEAQTDVGDQTGVPIDSTPNASESICGSPPDESTFSIGLPRGQVSTASSIQDPHCLAYLSSGPERVIPPVPYRPYAQATFEFPACEGSFKNKSRSSRSATVCLQWLRTDPVRRQTWETIRSSCVRKQTRTSLFGFTLRSTSACAPSRPARRFRAYVDYSVMRGLLKDEKKRVFPKEGVSLIC